MVRAAHLNRRLLAVCDYFLSGEESLISTIEKIDEQLWAFEAPEVFETAHPNNTLNDKVRR